MVQKQHEWMAEIPQILRKSRVGPVKALDTDQQNAKFRHQNCIVITAQNMQLIKKRCKRQSQKQIVIGAGGKILKNIGEQSRIDIEEYLNKKVFLKTWVKVKKNWNTDSNFIQSLGVGNNYESK